LTRSGFKAAQLEPGWVLEFRLPPNTPFLALIYGKERELLLPPCSTFVVHRVSKDSTTGLTHLTLTWLGSTWASPAATLPLSVLARYWIWNQHLMSLKIRKLPEETSLELWKQALAERCHLKATFSSPFLSGGRVGDHNLDIWDTLHYHDEQSGWRTGGAPKKTTVATPHKRKKRAVSPETRKRRQREKQRIRRRQKQAAVSGRRKVKEVVEKTESLARRYDMLLTNLQELDHVADRVQRLEGEKRYLRANEEKGIRWATADNDDEDDDEMEGTRTEWYRLDHQDKWSFWNILSVENTGLPRETIDRCLARAQHPKHGPIQRRKSGPLTRDEQREMGIFEHCVVRTLVYHAPLQTYNRFMWWLQDELNDKKERLGLLEDQKEAIEELTPLIQSWIGDNPLPKKPDTIKQALQVWTALNQLNLPEFHMNDLRLDNPTNLSIKQGKKATKEERVVPWRSPARVHPIFCYKGQTSAFCIAQRWSEQIIRDVSRFGDFVDFKAFQKTLKQAVKQHLFI
jgi:hypothetical protein